MTKTELAKNIIETVHNNPDPAEAMAGVIAYLDLLTPKDMERFAQWGYPHQKSTPEECWEEQSCKQQNK